MEQEVPNEFLLVLDDGDVDGDVKPANQRTKGAYYKNIERKIILKKKRANVSKTRRLICSLLTHLVAMGYILG